MLTNQRVRDNLKLEPPPDAFSLSALSRSGRIKNSPLAVNGYPFLGRSVSQRCASMVIELATGSHLVSTPRTPAFFL